MQLEWLTGGDCLAGMHEVVVTKRTLDAIELARQQNRSLWRVSSTVRIIKLLSGLALKIYCCQFLVLSFSLHYLINFSFPCSFLLLYHIAVWAHCLGCYIKALEPLCWNGRCQQIPCYCCRGICWTRAFSDQSEGKEGRSLDWYRTHQP